MYTKLIIEYVFTLTVLTYILAAIAVWIFDFKKNALYDELRKQIKFLENLSGSNALKIIKKYKIEEDYKKALDEIENAQEIITRNMFFLAKR